MDIFFNSNVDVDYLAARMYYIVHFVFLHLNCIQREITTCMYYRFVYLIRSGANPTYACELQRRRCKNLQRHE
jgi:hypothetical protein